MPRLCAKVVHGFGALEAKSLRLQQITRGKQIFNQERVLLFSAQVAAANYLASPLPT